MRLNHLNLAAPDLDEACLFLTTHFGLREVHRQGNLLAVLLDEGGFVLTVSQDKPPLYPKVFHVGFLQDDAASVDAVYQRLQDGGVPLSRPPAKVHGTYGFYFTGLGNVLFEVSAQQG